MARKKIIEGKNPVRKTKAKKKAVRKPSELAQLKKLIVKLIKKFENDLAHPEDFSGFWGEKENPVTVITKLSQILLKAFMVAEPKKSGRKISAIDAPITAADFQMVGEYMKDHPEVLQYEATDGNPE